jgi:hypothetical protein
MYIGTANTGYSATFFIPTILSELGWTAVHAQVMTIPIYVCAAIVTICISVTSDLVKHRYTFIMLGCFLAAVGYAILLNTENVSIHVRYMALFFITSGSSVAHPVIVGWLSNNLGGHVKRGVGSAVQIGLGNISGLIASNIYFPAEAPTYKTGYSTGLALILMTVIAATAMVLYLRAENRKREHGKRDYLWQLPPAEIANLGDDHPNFRYTY